MKEKYIGMVEVGEDIFYIVHRGDKLVAGTACNTGMIDHLSVDFDDIFSFDEKLEQLVKKLEDMQ